jgi:hypothetical protein
MSYIIRALRVLWFTALFLFIATLIIRCSAPYPPPPPPTTTSTIPGPSPSPTATPEACRFKSQDVDYWRSEVKQNGGGQALDFTPVACSNGAPPCNHPDSRRAHCCALGAEQGNQSCADALFGVPHWTPDKTVRLAGHNLGEGADGFTQKISEGQGGVSIFGSVAMALKPGAGVRLDVRAASPACTVGADGLCVLHQGIGEHYSICGREVTKTEWEDHLRWVAKENKK